MSPTSPTTPLTASALIHALEVTGPRPAIAWHGNDGRLELSGHVLANWIIKATNHLRDELMLDPGAVVALAMPPHWKRLVIALAAWSVGASVRVLGPDGVEGHLPAADADQDDQEPAVLVTDRPAEALEAEETLAVDPLSLAMRFSGELPPMVHDWVVEVRGHADQPTEALDQWSGPAPAADGPDLPDGAPFSARDDGLTDAPLLLAALSTGHLVNLGSA